MNTAGDGARRTDGDSLNLPSPSRTKTRPVGPRILTAVRQAPRSWDVGAPITYAYPDGSIAADGEVLEIDQGRRVVMAFHPRWSPDIDAEGPVRMTWAIEPGEGDGAPTRLVVTTAIVPGSRVAAEFPGGNAFIVSGLKTFLETGAPLALA